MVPVVLVVEEFPVDPCFRFETRIEIINNPDTRRGRQFTSVALAVDALRIHFVGMVQGRREGLCGNGTVTKRPRRLPCGRIDGVEAVRSHENAIAATTSR